jgi:putative transport protein
MVRLLGQNPLLLLFLVTAIGYPLGRIRVAGTSLGVASVLFAGLAVGAIDPSLKLPEIVYLLGLVLFIYTVGLASGPGFVASLRRKGLRDNALVALVLVLAGVATWGFGRWLKLETPLIAGLFCGGLTNTPALAAAIETLKLNGISGDAVTVGYSIAYPVGVIGPILAIAIAQRLWRTDYAQEARDLRDLAVSSQEIAVRTIEVTQREATGTRLKDLSAAFDWSVVFTRVLRGRDLTLSRGHTRLQIGDLITAVGSPEQLDEVTRVLGRESPVPLETDRTLLDHRHLFVSSRALAGRRLGDIDMQLWRRFGAVVTRIRRGDVELLPRASMVLELGDRVRVLAPRERLDGASEFFGDSYRSLSEIDVMGFSLGLAAGLALGMLPIPLPGGTTLRLGFAGGPLVAGLLLGARGFTGPVVWTVPYSANLTLRQIGLVLFLAGIGTRAGYSFISTVSSAGGLRLLLVGAAITTLAALLMLWVGHRLMRIPMSLLTGMVAGTQTQPAVLGFAVEQTGNDLPHVGYATVYPLATIGKIIVVQLLLG